ncbi:glutamate--cysteine ligase [Umezawaea sp. Da 62-37]|uniref:carboxylate-amine ligase n=1 Tax=Umezawaea sp. Da 62-37 TaxID=3075927 RepID=UPI0028F70735|nr:glutamate--cysteine ligase [Umezawaea sp. Da 62-37]WNV87160.1 glutamate--cysteine ligase [Umezawaea sp. Da 62-37]
MDQNRGHGTAVTAQGPRRSATSVGSASQVAGEPAFADGRSEGPESGRGVRVSERGGVTMGVEEEFLLADRATRRTAPRAPAVLARAGAGGPGHVHAELLTSQVETSTGVCGDLDEVREHVLSGRGRLGEAAREEDCLLLASGMPPLPGPDVRNTTGARFDSIADRYRAVVEDYESCGLHVHVGVSDRDTAIAVVNHLRPWLPTLLALSVNSPFAGGRDTGYGSWRVLRQSAFPGFGVPPRFGSAAEYDAEVSRLVDCGVLVDPRMSFWLVRPSSAFPTVEVRAADTALTVDGAVLQAGLTRALVRTALADLDRGVEGPEIDAQVAAAAVWSAARHGMTGPGVDVLLGRAAPAEDLLAGLFGHVREALEDTGDDTLVRRLLKELLADGTGAERQRQAAGRGRTALVDFVAEATASRA